MRAGGVLACRPGFGGEGNGEIAPHMLAGFLGGRPCTLHVRHAGGCDSYRGGTTSSQPLIPAALEEIFGPDQEERRRLSFRARLQHDMGWYLKSHPAPWRMFVFDEDRCEAGAAAATATAAIIKVDHQQRFEAALEAIRTFAAKVQSPFVVHFQLAKSLAAKARVDAPFNRLAFERICVSNNVPEHLTGTELIDLFAAFGWRPRRVLGLAGTAAADVFGAMGSWNDQSFDGDEAAQFAAVSSQLFCTMNGYLASLLTVELG